jgi:hypothetical protein
MRNIILVLIPWPGLSSDKVSSVYDLYIFPTITIRNFGGNKFTGKRIEDGTTIEY